MKDALRVLKQEVKDSKRIVDITDERAEFNEKGGIVCRQNSVRDAPIWKKRVER